jgi:pyruvate dehydrogenase E1 component alpha subunit
VTERFIREPFTRSLNLAKIWNLPAIYIVENNHFGMGTSVKRISGVEDFAIKAEGYDLPGHVLNGMDFLDVYEGIKKIADETRKTNTACLIDIKTYRYKGHSISDPAQVPDQGRARAVQEAGSDRPAEVQMIEAKMLTEDEFKQMDDELKAEVQEAVDFADKSEEPALHTMYEDIFWPEAAEQEKQYA